MKKNILNLEEVSLITKKEQQSINGGFDLGGGGGDGCFRFCRVQIGDFDCLPCNTSVIRFKCKTGIYGGICERVL